MNQKHNDSFEYTSSGAILVEFTSSGIPITDEVRRAPRFGRPSGEVLEERAQAAARFLRENNVPPVAPETSGTNEVDS